MPNDKKQLFTKLFGLRKWDMDFVDSVCNEFGHLRYGTFQINQTNPHIQTNVIKLLAKTLESSRERNEWIFHGKIVRLMKKLIFYNFIQQLLAMIGYLLFVYEMHGYQM